MENIKSETGKSGNRLSIINNLEEFTTDVSQLIQGKTYIVSTEHTLDTTLTLPANITLIFLGGTITGNGILTAEQTKLEAPITRIFGDNLIVGGTWVIDRAYPQWFGAKANCYGENIDNPNLNDAGEAINKAILMKRTGEVFIPRGDYQIAKTIIVKFGITLCGEDGRLSNYVGIDEPPILATVLRPLAKGNFYGDYMVMVNIKEPSNKTTQENAEWEYNHPTPGTKIKDIYFSNYHTERPDICGILFAGGIEIYNLHWDGFRQAVASAVYMYSDLKKIERCSFNPPWAAKLVTKGNLHAFDLNGAGDAIVFQQNMVDTYGYNDGLKIGSSLGAVISSNIINADVLLAGGQCITFESNHCELGIQVTIEQASVTVSNNYFEKRDRPTLVIKTINSNQTPVINLENNAFLFYDKDGFDIINNMSPYEIKTDGQVSLHITNSYRYWRIREMGSQFTYGIKMCNLNEEPIIDFNNQCPFLSTNGIIKPNSYIINNLPVKCISTDIFLFGAITWATWYAASGTYYYKYEILWDVKRHIKQNVKNIPESFTVTENGQGSLWYTSDNMAQCGFQATIRIYRGSSADVMNYYVDVPISGTKHFYDNGISICGFRWEPFSGTIENGNSDIESIKYRGKNCECWGSSCPTTGFWEKGDIVYNTGNITDNTLWIYIETSPGSGIYAWKAR